MLYSKSSRSEFLSLKHQQDILHKIKYCCKILTSIYKYTMHIIVNCTLWNNQNYLKTKIKKDNYKYKQILQLKLIENYNNMLKLVY